jgi:hypothetical protein
MDNQVEIISFTFPHEAHIAKGYLESNGIETFLKDEMTVQVNNFYSNAVGGVKLMIKESDYEQGLLLLKNSGYIKESSSNNSLKTEIVIMDSETDINICPFCKSCNINKKNKKINFLIIPFYFILGTILPIYKLSYKCFDCDKEWRYKK